MTVTPLHSYQISCDAPECTNRVRPPGWTLGAALTAARLSYGWLRENSEDLCPAHHTRPTPVSPPPGVKQAAAPRAQVSAPLLRQALGSVMV